MKNKDVTFICLLKSAFTDRCMCFYFVQVQLSPLKEDPKWKFSPYLPSSMPKESRMIQAFSIKNKQTHSMALNSLSGIFQVFRSPQIRKLIWKNMNYSFSKAGIFTVAAELKPMPHLEWVHELNCTLKVKMTFYLNLGSQDLDYARQDVYFSFFI